MSALQENLHPADRLTLIDLLADLLEWEDVALVVLGAAIERAELTVGDADVGVIDVAVDDVGDDISRIFPHPYLVGGKSDANKIMRFQKRRGVFGG